MHIHWIELDLFISRVSNDYANIIRLLSTPLCAIVINICFKVRQKRCAYAIRYALLVIDSEEACWKLQNIASMRTKSSGLNPNKSLLACQFSLWWSQCWYPVLNVTSLCVRQHSASAARMLYAVQNADGVHADIHLSLDKCTNWSNGLKFLWKIVSSLLYDLPF